MALLTLACLASILEVIAAGYQGRLLSFGLLIIGLGTALTIIRRLGLIAGLLQERPVE
jgi:hypothetical protein